MKPAETTKQTLIGQVPESQIEAWKKEHTLGIYSVTSASGHVGYFKNPNRNEVNYALSRNDQPLSPLHALMETTFIGGSETMIKDDSVALGTMNALKGKMDGIQAALVNL